MSLHVLMFFKVLWFIAGREPITLCWNFFSSKKSIIVEFLSSFSKNPEIIDQVFFVDRQQMSTYYITYLGWYDICLWSSFLNEESICRALWSFNGKSGVSTSDGSCTRKRISNQSILSEISHKLNKILLQSHFQTNHLIIQTIWHENEEKTSSTCLY